MIVAINQGTVTPAGLMPRLRRFTVTGLFEAGMYEYDRGTAFVHMSFGQLLKWLLVVITLGIEELSFPASTLAQIVAVSVQVLGFAIVGWVGARVISTLVSKISERRTMKSV